MNLLLALVWLGLGIYLIVLHATTDVQNFRLFFLPGNPSGGWLAVLLAVYNFIQWWARLSIQRQMRETQLREAERQERLMRDRDEREGRQVDPNFQFTDKPGDEKKS